MDHPSFLADTSLPITGFGKGLYQNPAGGAVTNRFTEIVSAVVSALTIFGGLAFLVWFVVGALQWASSGGNPEQLNKAKAQMGTAVAGLFILIISTSIIWIVGKVTGLDIINLENLIKKVTP